MLDGELPASSLPLVLALAIRFDRLVADGVVANYADLARLGRVSRARLTQIMNLLHLAPEIQEEILFLPATERGMNEVTERDLRSVVAEVDWVKQRRMWRRRLQAKMVAGASAAGRSRCRRRAVTAAEVAFTACSLAKRQTGCHG